MALHGCNLHGTGGILHGHERTCKICSIFMPRLDIDPSQVLSRSHGKSWQDLENFFLRAVSLGYALIPDTLIKVYSTHRAVSLGHGL